MDTKPLESDTPWLNPDNLMDFLDELREVGFAVVVPDYIKVHQLVVQLLANGVELNQSKQFERYLRPLLCSSEIEQNKFQQRFANWIASLDVTINTTKQNQAKEAFQEEVELIRQPWQAPQYLERQSTKDRPQLDTISIAYDTEALFPAIAFFRLAERMRRRVRVVSQEIDIHATLQHTLSHGGWLIPVRGTRLQVPEYLVLIDRTTFRDHQTRLIEEMVAQLTEHEVFATIFFFDRDPRVCYPADGKRRGVTLQALSKSHADHRLLLFADAQHLFHPLRNELAVWTDFFSTWSERVLLTTKSREHWGYYEIELQSVMTVLPATADSLTTFVMGDLLDSQRQNTEQTRCPLPRLLTERPYRWLSRDQPDEGLIAQVLLGLRAYLDQACFFWLCACAIFPNLQWDITLYLGQQLKTDEGSPLLRNDRLVDLVRLPWFRHGYMPDWFRLYLISSLTPAQEQHVRQTLQALLLNAVSGTVGSQSLEIARPPDHLQFPSIFRLLAHNASENSFFQDYIFRTFVINNRQLSVQMPIQLLTNSIRTFVVSQTGKGDYKTISEAIQNASVGSQILVRPGFYTESLILDKPLEIRGDGPVEDIIVESIDASCLRMKSSQARVHGLTLRGRVGPKGNSFYIVDIPQGELLLEDCDISSDSLACVAIYGADTNPTIRRCKIHHGKQAGVFVYKNGQGKLEECEIFANTKAGIVIAQGGNPLIQHCRIYHGKANGVYVYFKGQGIIEECEIFGNAYAGVAIKEAGHPVIRQSKIHKGLQSGVRVYKRGQGIIEKCEIFGNAKAGIEIKQAGNPLIRHCKIYEGQQDGIFVGENGQGTIEACEILKNAEAGIRIGPNANPVVRGCQIRQNKYYIVKEDGNNVILLEKQNLTGQAHAVWNLESRLLGK